MIIIPKGPCNVAIWYILRAQRGSHIPTLRAKYIPYSYMDPLGIRMITMIIVITMNICSHVYIPHANQYTRYIISS